MNNKESHSTQKIPSIKNYVLIILRVVIGWHFLYEGVHKLLEPNWTSQGYLMVSKWLFSDIFHWIASHATVLTIVDFLNIYGLIGIGLGLILGCCTRIATGSGIVLLLLYYVTNPPFIGMDFGVVTEGNYLIVDKNLVELVALVVLFIYPTGTFLGLDRLWMLRKRGHVVTDPALFSTPSEQGQEQKVVLNRREVLKNLATTPLLGAFTIAVLKKQGWDSYEEKALIKHQANR